MVMPWDDSSIQSHEEFVIIFSLKIAPIVASHYIGIQRLGVVFVLDLAYINAFCDHDDAKLLLQGVLAPNSGVLEKGNMALTILWRQHGGWIRKFFCVK